MQSLNKVFEVIKGTRERSTQGQPKISYAAVNG